MDVMPRITSGVILHVVRGKSEEVLELDICSICTKEWDGD